MFLDREEYSWDRGSRWRDPNLRKFRRGGIYILAAEYRFWQQEPLCYIFHIPLYTVPNLNHWEVYGDSWTTLSCADTSEVILSRPKHKWLVFKRFVEASKVCCKSISAKLKSRWEWMLRKGRRVFLRIDSNIIFFCLTFPKVSFHLS